MELFGGFMGGELVIEARRLFFRDGAFNSIRSIIYTFGLLDLDIPTANLHLDLQDRSLLSFKLQRHQMSTIIFGKYFSLGQSRFGSIFFEAS